MAESTCVKCGNHGFELKEAMPTGSNVKMYFVQCAACGGVVSTLDWFSISQLIMQQNEAIKKIARQFRVNVDLPS